MRQSFRHNPFSIGLGYLGLHRRPMTDTICPHPAKRQKEKKKKKKKKNTKDVGKQSKTIQAKRLITLELQWLEHLWNHENKFETGVVRASEYYSLREVMGQNWDIFLIFL